jgi:eukaryotic-like serine/threonine-protein kinase
MERIAASPGGSRRMIGRGPWFAKGGDEESRATFQSRLIVLSRLMFWSFVVLIVGMFLLYEAHGDIEPDDQETIYVIAGAGLLVQGVIWRGFLLRRKLSFEQLYAVDLIYGFGTGAVFAGAAFVAREYHFPTTANLLWTCLVIFLRTIVVPSTGRRTTIVGIATFLPMLPAAIGLSVYSKQELPEDALIGSVVIIGCVVILLATIGSRIIWGLRRQVESAMRLGQYTLGGQIGIGGNGEVHHAHHAMLRRPTAIKVMRPDRIAPQTLDRFEQEVQAMSKLTHPNTVAVYDYGRSPEGLFYYAMEYLEGIDLDKLVIEYGPQPGDRVIAILVQVCGALHEAHCRGMTHRDIKPANIILCERGQMPDVAKVVDFGLVKEADSPDDGRSIACTPHYAAPEIMNAPDRIGPATDLYALGAVAYFLLTGRRVFDGATDYDVCIKQVQEAPAPPSKHRPVSPPLENLILSCLAKKPDDRPASAADLAIALKAIPPAGDWTEDRARAWWREFRKTPHPTSTGPTRTITVDIGSRE